ncbi:MAG: tetratricopeptide repeat protein [Elusimicrobia bacterium]|nr:tetratricopeptide repeat protein [Elusimicrobiota bacterium]
MQLIIVRIVQASALLLAAALAACGRSLAAPLREVGRGYLVALALLIAVDLALLKPAVPHNIWHEQHAVSFVIQVEDGASEGLQNLHGPTYGTVMRAFHLLSGKRLSVFSINYAIAGVSVVLLFLLVYLLFDSGSLALLAASLLTFLPAHIRLSATECSFILVESMSLLTLLLFTLFLKGRRPRFFLAGLLSLLNLMHLRAEMMLLAPAMVFVYFLIMDEGPRWDFLRSAPIRAGLAAAALLTIPRVIEILHTADPRIKQIGPLALPHPVPVNDIFFDMGWTPPLYLVLFLVGFIGMAVRHRRAFLFFNAYWLCAVGFYWAHRTCIALKVRTGMADQFVLVVIAAYGTHALIRVLLGRSRILGLALAHGALAASLLGYWDVIQTLYTRQQEFLFLQEAGGKLPARSALVYLSGQDDPGVASSREYQKEALESAAARMGKKVLPMGIRRFLRTQDIVAMKPVYFYKGVACHVIPWAAGPGAAGSQVDASMMVDGENPACRLMEDSFLLKPVTTASITDRPHGWDRMTGDGKVIGLYQVLPRGRTEGRNRVIDGRGKQELLSLIREIDGVAGDPASTLAALDRLAGRLPRDAAVQVERAQAAARLGRREEALSALRRAEGLGPGEPDLRAVAGIYSRLKEPAKALAALDALARARPDSAALQVERAEFLAGLGRREEALSALRRAEGLGPGEPDLRAIGGIYKELKEPAKALAALERLARKRPDDGGVQVERALLSLDLGRKADAVDAFRRAEALKVGGDDLRRVAWGYQSLGRCPDSLRVWEALLRGPRPRSKDYSDKAVCEYLLGRKKEAVLDLNRAIKIDPAGLEAYVSLGAIYSNQGAAQKALEMYERGLAVPAGPAMERARQQLLDGRETARRKMASP